MKKSLTLSLLFSILFNSLGQSVILVHYLTNKKYYATVLCENITKPNLHCNGKCHLMKEMKEQEKKEQSPTTPTKVKQETVQLFQKNTPFAFYIFDKKGEYNSFYRLPKPQTVNFSIFHPPTV